MLTLFFLIIWRTVAIIHGYVLAYAPTNIAIAYLRTPRGLKWAIPSAFVAIPAYLYVAWLMTVLVDRGATEWLLLITMICYIDAVKFVTLGLISPFVCLGAVVARRSSRLRSAAVAIGSAVAIKSVNSDILTEHDGSRGDTYGGSHRDGSARAVGSDQAGRTTLADFSGGEPVTDLEVA